jgi:hypothetical protein
LLPEDARPMLVDTVTSPEALTAAAVPAEPAPIAKVRETATTTPRFFGFRSVIGMTLSSLVMKSGTPSGPSARPQGIGTYPCDYPAHREDTRKD